MSYMIAMGSCVGCGCVMCFNPHKVPSILVKGVREPVCRTCIERANPQRKAMGLEEFKIQPGAYEPADEENDREEFLS